MKIKALVYCIILFMITLSLLSMVIQVYEYIEIAEYYRTQTDNDEDVYLNSTQAQENKYTKVKAEYILKKIGNGEDVNLTKCRIVGELNLSDIELETIPNPKYQEFLEFYKDPRYSQVANPEKFLEKDGVNRELKVINSTITIQNSIFENDVYLSNLIFKKPLLMVGNSFSSNAYFTSTFFNNTTNLSFSNFTYHTNFDFVTFNDHAMIYRASFNYARFNKATFNDHIDFFGTNFKDYVSFTSATFGSDAYLGATFINGADCDADFRGDVDFNGASFGDVTCFNGATFNDNAKFTGPISPENIITDRISSQPFIKDYKIKGRYEDADLIYYNYRKNIQAHKHWYEISKWIDFIIWCTCGYGVKPSHTLYLGGTLIILFSIIYAKGPVISLDNISNEKIPLRFYLQGPGIEKRKEDSEDQPQKVSYKDALYFSVNTFTTVGHANWYPKENFKKWATLEGLLGWTILGIFMATLTAVMIRV